jgi:hypothetical protein
MHRNLLIGSTICIVLVSLAWAAAMWPSLLGRTGAKLLLGGGLIVPAAGAILAVLSFSAAGRLRPWAVASAAANVVYCAAYWVFVLG